jgi:hypothetical protein
MFDYTNGTIAAGSLRNNGFRDISILILMNVWRRDLSEESYLMRYNAVYSVESQPIFLRNMSSPSSGSLLCLLSASCWFYAWFIIRTKKKTEAAYSSVTSFDFQRTTRRYISEDTTHHHRWKILKSYQRSILRIIWNSSARNPLPVDFLFSLFCDPEDSGDMFHRIICLFWTGYMTLSPRG